jgi:hypothetical protein
VYADIRPYVLILIVFQCRSERNIAREMHVFNYTENSPINMVKNYIHYINIYSNIPGITQLASSKIIKIFA